MEEALYYRTIGKRAVKCLLCPHYCIIEDTEAGRCKVRENIDGKLIAKSYGIVSAVHYDPIEKKPLFHFYPGGKILSIGSYGCNFGCSFCQNWEISQFVPPHPDACNHMNVENIIQKAREYPDNIGIAFTYNEPMVNFEFMLELANKAKKEGLKTAMITNGFISEKPLKELLPVIDAFNVDLKVFSNKLYRTTTGGRLNPVLRALKVIRQSDKHLEITHLVITGLNDKIPLFDPMINWISNELGNLSVLHISRYFPGYNSTQPPTSPSTLNYLFNLAREKLPYSYLGNIILAGASDTYCHNCHALVIERQVYETRMVGLDGRGNCAACGQPLVVRS